MDEGIQTRRIIPATLCIATTLKSDGIYWLMLHRNKHPEHFGYKKWTPVGGKIKPCETPDECVVREVGEESGNKIEQTTLQGIVTFYNYGRTSDYADKFFGDYRVYVYSTNITNPVMDWINDEGEIHWGHYKQVFSLPMFEGDKALFRWYKRGDMFLGKILYEGETLLKASARFYPDNGNPYDS